MNNKCFITKLNGTVDNDNLTVFGEVIVDLKADGCTVYYDSNSTGNTVTDLLTEESKSQVDNAVVFNTTTNPGKDFSLGSYRVTDKYNITAFYGIRNYSVEEFSKWGKINFFFGENMKGKTENLSGFSLVGFNIQNSSEFSGDINDMLDVVNKGIHTIILSGVANISGSLNTFLDALVTKGKTSGQLTAYFHNTGVKYNNSTIEGSKTIKFGSSMVNPTSQETTQGWQMA